MPAETAVTKILAELAEGDRTAAQRLLPHVYNELRALAGHLFQKQTDGHTLQPTALVHEAFLKLVGAADQNWTSRKHFFDVAALAMRQLLTDHARRHASLKRGGDLCRVSLPEAVTPINGTTEVDLLALHRALEKLSSLDPRQGRIAELRYLVGLSVEETAEVLDVSPRTVKLDWQMARSFLRRELSGT
ncbi:MAG: sigma-70 family RNA polymerase sigma factor [Planctomycetes bacterium]|nr:sigma-70 family RNA polymerase sigma factor [Planctomycetota bacterium]